ncbi:sensor domain-containing diguanylate cyclase [Thalassotalea piscium]|uniref:diguanylate cyclase n=1 Tax=Thalassotalea piscium TaxID=1230533 RepID=A0A7X0NE79_9GAMM|nr:sensor domain-containing diguanylate cyclase [Thalassotalea piscium]MBB6541818.1 diguanylate cyclase (GGDEF)-like protein [Thalassotalea piscium]
MSLDSYCSHITDKINTGILVLDLDYNIVMWNRFMQIHVNKKSDEVLGKNIFEVFSELPQRWFERKLSSVTQLNTQSFCSWEQRHHLFELPHTRPITTDSVFMAQNCTFSPVIDEGKITNICILIEDATDVYHYQTKLNGALEQLALSNRIDGLTQVFNRKHWEECLANEFSRARRYDHGLALIMFDLDYFKLLNDTFGHQGGDKVLIDVATQVQSLLRTCDIFGRYGGEEFAIILPETDLTGAIDVAKRVRSTIENMTVTFQEDHIKATVSVGVAVMNNEDKRYEDLISNTDIALYKAKSSGRNMVFTAKETRECA